MPLAANTISLFWRPLIDVLSFSYHTTHGTLSLAPVNAMSGSTPLRVGSTLRLGSTRPGPTRGMPVCCQQKPPIAGYVAGYGDTRRLDPVAFAVPGPIGRSMKI